MKELKVITDRHKDSRNVYSKISQQEYREPKREILFTERESEILKALEANREDIRSIIQIKEVFPGSRIRLAYKININNSKRPIEKIKPKSKDENMWGRKARQQQRVLL